ncbi:MAG: alpha-amylase family glycosyl hydrolase [Rhodothermales bacterium]
MKRSLVLVLLAVALATAATAQPDRPLRPVPLVAGQPDTVLVADLFPDSDGLSFGASDEVEARYDAAVGTLALTARSDFEGLALVPFRQRGEAFVLPVRSRVLTPHRFTFRATAPVSEVFVIGQFNDWSRSATPLADPDGHGVWETTVPLEPGRYEYKFTADGAEVLDPDNPARVPNGLGGTNNVLTIPPRHTASVDLLTLSATDDHLRFAFLRDGAPAPVRPSDVVALVGNRPVASEAVSVEGHEVRVRRMPEMDGETARVAVRQGGQATRFATVTLGDDFAWRDAVLYQILVDRWADGDPANSVPVPHDSVAARANYHGGDLQGILDKMNEGYFDSLGVNVLWLSPVVENTDRAYREYPPPHRYYTGYHGYWPTDPEAVEGRFGDMDLLRDVVDAAHARGMKVLLDYVANHTHEEHPYFQQHRDWFGVLDLPDGRKNLRLWDEHRLTTWFEPYLPSFDFEGSEEALQVMTDNAVWWIETSGADGFRHDAVKHIPNRFWRTLTRKLRAVDSVRVAEGEPPLYQIGETFGSYDLIASYVTPGQLDAQFNFNLYDTAKYVFLDPDADFAVLDAEMQKTLDVYGPDHVMGTLMDSHDKARFLAYADGDLARDAADDKEIGWLTDIAVDDPASYRRAELYLAYLLTTPGVPTIYYGDEIGMTGANDPDNRRPMRFGDDVTPDERALKEDVAALVRLRRERESLRRGGFHTLRAEGDLWAYLRAGAEGRTLVVLNKGDAPETFALDLPAPLASRAARDALTGEAVSVAGRRVTLAVPSVGYRVVDLD